MTTNEPKRYANVAIVRLILTLMVFVFHSLYIYSRTYTEAFFPLSAALQGFNFLAAYLCSRKNVVSWKGYYRRRMTTLIAPSIVAFLPILLSTFVFAASTGPLSWDLFIEGFAGRSANGFFLLSFGPLWYTGVMILLFALAPLFFLARRKTWVWFLLFAGGIIEVCVSGWLWQPIVYLPFALGFFYGFKTGETDLAPKNTRGFKGSWLAPLLILAVCALANFLIRSNVKPTLHVESFFMTVSLRAVQTFVGASLVLFLFRILRFFGEQKNRPFLDWTDRLSYPFFLVHFAFMVGAFDLSKYISPLPLAIVAAFLCSLLVSWLVSLSTETIIKKASLPKRRVAEELKNA